MNTYSIDWTEVHNAVVEADNEAEAIAKVKSGDYNTGSETAELQGEPVAQLLDNK